MVNLSKTWTYNIVNSIQEFIQKNHLVSANTTIIVGLSGGPDSVFLLFILNQYYKVHNIRLIAAHLDHEWRSSSAEDALFCQRLCNQWQITCVIKKLSEMSLQHRYNGSPEAYARHARRTFFEQLCKEYGADAIALAHHAQDQQETFFMRLIRGTTLSGLIGIKPRNGVYIRPLLLTDKKDILSFLTKHNLPYRTDPTNHSAAFLRNRIRMDVLPAITASDKRFDANFLHLIENLQEVDAYLDAHVVNLYSQITHKTINGNDEINIDRFAQIEPLLQKRIILHWLIVHQVPFTPTAKFIAEITRFFAACRSATHKIHTNWRLVKKKQFISIVKDS